MYVVDGGWLNWTETNCSKKCNGFKKKIRSCNNPKPSCEGKDCSGVAEQVVECNTTDCIGR